jgi:polyisoprenoid-binding protein YceI
MRIENVVIYLESIFYLRTKKNMKKDILFVGLFLVSMGFVACNKPSGEEAKVGDQVEVAEATNAATTYAVNPAASSVLWEGSKLTGKHNGTVAIKSGELSVKDGKIESGKFVMDMASINVLDLEGDKKADLEAHLKGSGQDGTDDFFNAGKFPEAVFEISEVRALEGDTTANSVVLGNLTIKGVTNSVEFKANISSDPTSLTASTPQFTIDRTKWGINFMSNSVQKLKDKAINDQIGLGIILNATKQ